MARRYIGDAIVDIRYDDRHSDYRGSVSAGGRTWKFTDLHEPRIGFGHGVDSPEAYDKMAVSAVGFGSYYTTHNRSDDVPDWAPNPETADAIDEAVSWATDEAGRGQYEVRRSPNGRGKFVG